MASKGFKFAKYNYNITQLPSEGADVLFLFHQIPKITIPTRMMKVRISTIDSATTIASAIKILIISNDIGYIIPSLLQSCAGRGVVGENKTAEDVDTNSVEDGKSVLSTE